MKNSTIIYLIGASGAGKDTLLKNLRNNGTSTSKIIVAHRYITRPINVIDENYIYLSTEEFEDRKANGLFLFSWSSNGNNYGIGIEVLDWLNKGFSVVINGSREYLDTAMQIYQNIQPVLVEVEPSVLRKRLVERNRETPQQIESRIERAISLSTVSCDNLIKINSNGSENKTLAMFYNVINNLMITTDTINTN